MKKKIYNINGKQYRISDEENVIDGGYYLVNDTICQFKNGLFFFETEDGTKWFSPLDCPKNTEAFLLEPIE